MKEAIQQYIEELYKRIEDLEGGIEVGNPQQRKEDTSLINETAHVICRLQGIINVYGDEKPLIENRSIDTEETKTENWRLTKYP